MTAERSLKHPIRDISYSDSEFSLLIRSLQESDAEPVHSAVVLSLKNLRPFMDWSHQELSIENQIERIRRSQESSSKGIEYDFSVFDKEKDRFMMSASLHIPRMLNKKSRSIGYWTSIKHCNKGLATLVTKILTVIAFEYLGCDRVEIGCNKANKNSLRVIEKCGFKCEGEFRNYFSEPTEEMIRNGFSPERTGLLFALIMQDVLDIPWYQNAKNKIAVNLL